MTIKEVINSTGKIFKSIFDTETKFRSGKINAIGLISYFVVLLVLCIGHWGINVINVILTSFKKDILPAFGAGYIIISLIVLMFFTVWCTYIVKNTEKK